MINNSNALQQANAYRDISEQFVVDASFLWLLRSIGVKQPHYYLEDLSALEKRIDANLDGLMCNFELAWDICLEELTYQQAGETFTAAIIAFRSRNVNKIKQVIDHAFSNDDTFKGLVSAMAWLPKNLINDWVERFLYSKDLNHKYLAIAFYGVKRKNPGNILQELFQREDCLAHHKLLVRLLRLVGELKLYTFANQVQSLASHESPEIAFWANWSLVMLGEHKRVLTLLDFIKEESSWQGLAIQTVFKVLPIDMSRKWISEFAQKPEMIRTVIRATGVLGDPHAVPWLIDRMSHFDTAKIAGEAFSLITGIDLERYELTIEPPEDITVVPSDDDNEDVSLDEDEHLPFPDVNKINHTWLRYRDRYKAGSRYILGIEVAKNNPATIAKLNNTLKQIPQRQRASVALTLALLDPQSPYVNVKAMSII
ncbi:MAG: TIGR02270 family protein [Colwellia sp.]|uniref:TIGR02270 family protein n=1 Tax=Colwellia sp. TaxID=56799 RepID=UPI001DA3518A|nr:TIGR02270 family protein [Colwellia sp.]NQY50168.1 TIGR02270 family protein [Colwellia sp.]